MRYYDNTKQLMKCILFLTIVYFLAHGFILILTGTFHDDWLSFFRDVTTKNLEGIESGRPYYSALIEMIWNLPGYSYRLIIFLIYYIVSILSFLILTSIRGLGVRAAFCISLINIVLPVNDARVLLANYPYAVGMLLFYTATLLLVKWGTDFSVIWKRILVLSIFFFSFILQSNMMIYACVIFLMFIKIGLRKVIKYIDFIIIPIVFYVLNKILFPVHGAYAGYNIVTIDKLISSLRTLPYASVNTMSSIITRLFEKWYLGWTFVLIFILATVVVCRRRRVFDFLNEPACQESDFFIIVAGIMLFFFGILPYQIIRQSTSIAIEGIQGRDSMQLGIGASMLLYGLLRDRIKETVTIALVVVGIMCFNRQYLTYQMEWYNQIGFQEGICKLEDIVDGGNYIVHYDSDPSLQDTRFYTLTGNACATLDKKDILLLNGEKDLQILNGEGSMESIVRHYPMLADYDINDKTIKGELFFSSSINLKETITIKIDELIKPGSERSYMAEHSRLEYSEH